MNHHEALGRYVELKEQIEAKRTQRHALLNNLAVAADAVRRDPLAAFDFAAARALLDGAAQAEAECRSLEPQLRITAEACGKRP